MSNKRKRIEEIDDKTQEHKPIKKLELYTYNIGNILRKFRTLA